MTPVIDVPNIRKFIVQGLNDYAITPDGNMDVWAQGIGDEYHTMHELYKHRMALNIALFHAFAHLAEFGYKVQVMKAKQHHDGTMFEGGYFVVLAVTPVGQISYHYELKHWDKFDIPEVDRTPPYDGHSAVDVLARLRTLPLRRGV